MNKAQGRRSNKNKGKYLAQFTVTMKNKQRRIDRDAAKKR